MARSLRDFKCEACEKIVEKYIDVETTQSQCDCGGTSNRIIGTPMVRLEGISGDFPDAHAKWARIREDNAKIKARRG